jgi:RNA polymerase sigma-70 factor (ECF subfamily)
VTGQISSAVVGDGVAISRSLTTPEAFGAIFDRHFDAIYRYLARRVGRERAEDLASQTFVVAFERRAGFQLDVDSARPWLYGIATKLLANDRRAEQRLLEMLVRLGAQARDEVVQISVLADTDRGLAGVLASLEPGQRDVLFLHVWAGLTYEEIAGSLGLALGTVSSRISRARASLRADLGSAGATSASTAAEEAL